MSIWTLAFWNAHEHPELACLLLGSAMAQHLAKERRRLSPNLVSNYLLTDWVR